MISRVARGAAALLVAGAIGAGGAVGAEAQERVPGANPFAPDPAAAGLATFFDELAGLWAAADVAAISELLSPDGAAVIEQGAGGAITHPRRAATALRAFFGGRESLAATVASTALAATSPPRGFGEIVWSSRVRGAPGEESRSVFVATIRGQEGWRIVELRFLP